MLITIEPHLLTLPHPQISIISIKFNSFCVKVDFIFSIGIMINLIFVKVIIKIEDVIQLVIIKLILGEI